MSSFTKIVKDETRKEILIYLHNKGEATYSDILHDMKLSTGKLNYHLKILEPLLSKEGNYYKLNDKGNQLAEIMLNLGNDKKEFQYNRLLPQFLVLISFTFLVISETISHSNAFYALYIISIIALFSSLFLIYTMDEVNGFENLMILLSLFFPYASVFIHIFIFYNDPILAFRYYLPAVMSPVGSIPHFYIYELLPTLIYYFGILPKFINYNVELTEIIFIILLLTELFEGLGHLIDLTPILLGLSLFINRESLKKYRIFLVASIAIVVFSILFTTFIT